MWLIDDHICGSIDVEKSLQKSIKNILFDTQNIFEENVNRKVANVMLSMNGPLRSVKVCLQNFSPVIVQKLTI